MNKNKLCELIEKIKLLCIKLKLNFVIVGSVAYRKGESMDICDDFDCIIIYDDIEKLSLIPYINKKLYLTAKKYLDKKEIDLFSTKFKLNDIKVSMDFISIDYFKKLAYSIPKGYSEILRKLTDAEELPFNDYYSFLGEKFIYNKQKYKIDSFNVYKLPKFIYKESTFFSGVLYNKFIHNPDFKFVYNQNILELHKILLNNYVNFYKSKKKINSNIDIHKSIRNWSKFSEESKLFINQLFE